MSEFVHLHVHSHYSLLDGAIRIPDLVKRTKELGMSAVALTDLNNLFGSIEFYLEAKAAGIKPILGTEFLCSPFVASDDRPFHFVALCENLKGYQALCRLLTRAYEEKAAGPENAVARVKPEWLYEEQDGLIFLTGCLKGELAWLMHKGELERAEELVTKLRDKFKDRLYLEIQDMGLPEQSSVLNHIVGLGKKLGVPCVASNDCHTLAAEEASAHEVLQCIEQGRRLDPYRPASLVPSDFFFKSGEAMVERLGAFPEALKNSVEIAKRCDVQFKFKDDKGRAIYHLPNFRPSHLKAGEAYDLIADFRARSEAGLLERLRELQITDEPTKQQYFERLRGELAMIEKTGFAGYFLIVSDFIIWAKLRDIPVGPGRGSGAGSLVAYALSITDIDPIQFKLLFERFINPERISMPDFDVDFCQDRREEVLKYVAEKYGAKNVGQIITFGKLQARAVVKDVGRVLGLTFGESDQLTKLFPEELNITLPDVLAREPRIPELMEKDARIRQVFEVSQRLEGLCRNAGVHAAGVIITEHPIESYCPLYVGREGVRVTQLDKDYCEKIGLVKFDFLGLKTLTVISQAEKLAGIKLSKVKYDDAATYALVSNGDTDGVFQVESSGMKDLCTRLRPNTIEDLTAINALYRPGPLGSGMVDDFIDCKHGRKPIEYALPELETILRETYGVILYQEQVMQIARELAGYSLGQADMLRRAMGKKKAEEMAAQRETFVTGATERGIPQNKAAGVFDLMAKFAEYGFNKSHSAAYAVLTYQTAYLKCHHPAEFYAALMTTEMGNTEKMTRYISDARSHDLQVLGPDVNVSAAKFSIELLKAPEDSRDGKEGAQAGRAGHEVKAVRFGLEAIKGVGSAAVEAIIEARSKQPFESVADFSRRVSTRKANKKVLEALIQSGALDSINDSNRPSLLASIEALLEHGSAEQEESALGQASLFDAFSSQELKIASPSSSLIRKEPDWSFSKKLQSEKAVLGFYVSGHPLDPWQKICETWLGWDLEKVATRAPKSGAVKLAVVLSELKEITTKKGQRMAFARLEDLRGAGELVCFPDAFATYGEKLRSALADTEVLLVEAEAEARDGETKLILRKVEVLENAHRERVKKVRLRINPEKTSVDALRQLKGKILANRGACDVTLEFRGDNFSTTLQLPKELGVNPGPGFLLDVQKLLGPEALVV